MISLKLISSQHHNHFLFLKKCDMSVNYINLSTYSYTPALYISMIYSFQRGFEDAASPIIELLHFHDHTLIIVFLISSLFLYIISLMSTTKLTHKHFRCIRSRNDVDLPTKHHINPNCPPVSANSLCKRWN